MACQGLCTTKGLTVSDDEFQIWCRKCVFGITPFNRSMAEQNKALEAAIKDIS